MRAHGTYHARRAEARLPVHDARRGSLVRRREDMFWNTSVDISGTIINPGTSPNGTIGRGGPGRVPSVTALTAPHCCSCRPLPGGQGPWHPRLPSSESPNPPARTQEDRGGTRCIAGQGATSSPTCEQETLRQDSKASVQRIVLVVEAVSDNGRRFMAMRLRSWATSARIPFPCWTAPGLMDLFG